jgi:Zn ribbon nucleic-acid-binding protein
MPYKDKEVHRQYRIKRYNDTVEWIRNYKVEQGCFDCGYNEHHAGLEFDHREEKDKNVPAMASYSRAKLLSEIAKCDVVCGTCHNIRTYNRKTMVSIA